MPVDRSQRARDAVDTAVHFAESGKGSVTLLHAIEVIQDTTYEEFRDFYDSLVDQAHAEMEALLAPHRTSDVIVDAEVVFGNRGQEILRTAEERSFDLIVLQSHHINVDEPGTGGAPSVTA